MRTFIITMLILLNATVSKGQERNIETKSVSLENLITFIVENYAIRNTDTEQTKNLTFLIQVPQVNNTSQEGIILKQAFKLLSSRLDEENKISIVTYSGINGVALKQTSPKNLKKILYTVDNLNSSVKEFHEDGIILAYKYANEIFNEDAINTVVMVRSSTVSSSVSNHQSVTNTNKSKRVRNGAVLITALSLLPELISVIKD